MDINTQLETEIHFALKQTEMTLFREENYYRPGITRPTTEEWKDRTQWLYKVLQKVIADARFQLTQTIYVVFYNNKMVFAFHKQQDAESYIARATENAPGIYNRANLYWRSTDIFVTE